MLPVRSASARVPVGRMSRRPRRRCVLPERPRRLAIGVRRLEEVGAVELNDVGAKEGLRRMR